MLKLSLALCAAAAALAAAASPARADETSELIDKLKMYVQPPGYFDDQKWSEAYRFDLDPAGCMPLVEKLRGLGVDQNERFAGYMADTWRLKQGEALCERYRDYYLMINASGVAQDVAGYLDGEVSRYELHHVDKLEACIAKLDAFVASGMSADKRIVVDIFKKTEMSVADVKKGCSDQLAKAQADLDARRKAAEDQETAEVAKWAKLGVSGERLKVLSRHSSFWLKGCEESDDPRKLAKAKLVRIISHNDLLLYVKTWHFKGNKVSKMTEVTWDRRDMRRACK